MFYGESKLDGDFRVTDVSDAAFKEFLQFFYLGEVELGGIVEYIADVIHLGYKFNVLACVVVCAKFLKDTGTADNILTTLSLAIHYDHAGLMKCCEKFIILNTSAIFKSNGFLECNHPILAHVVNANYSVDNLKKCWIEIFLLHFHQFVVHRHFSNPPIRIKWPVHSPSTYYPQ